MLTLLLFFRGGGLYLFKNADIQDDVQTSQKRTALAGMS